MINMDDKGSQCIIQYRTNALQIRSTIAKIKLPHFQSLQYFEISLESGKLYLRQLVSRFSEELEK